MVEDEIDIVVLVTKRDALLNKGSRPRRRHCGVWDDQSVAWQIFILS